MNHTHNHATAQRSYVDVVMALLEANSEVINWPDSDGDCPLHNAARGDHTAVVRCLLNAGGDAERMNKVRPPAVLLFLWLCVEMIGEA